MAEVKGAVWAAAEDAAAEEDKRGLMKIAVATNQKIGLKGKIAEHFGQAKYYLIYDTDGKEMTIKSNPEFLGQPEMPPDFLNRLKVNSVITFGLGPKAYDKFKKYKIKMYKATPKTILENIKLLELKSLGRLTQKDIF